MMINPNITPNSSQGNNSILNNLNSSNNGIVEDININLNNNLNKVSKNQGINSSPLVNPSLVILHEDVCIINCSFCSMSKTYSKFSKDELVNFNSYQTQNQFRRQKKNGPEQEPTFEKIIIPKQEEQFIFDMSINVKYGDPLQIYHSFNIIYTQILNDIPIEYILLCDEMIKSICAIMEKCDFLEFGILCSKIIGKILNLVQKKISL